MQSDNPHKGSKVWLILIIIILIGGVAFGATKGKTAVLTTLNNWRLIPEPERFTELYFNDASSLPRQTTQGVPLTFSFTIHNVEYATTTYPYRVYFQYPFGSKVSFAAGTVTLAPNNSAAVNVSHTSLESDEHGMVVVELTSLDQSIDFLLPDTN